MAFGNETGGECRVKMLGISCSSRDGLLRVSDELLKTIVVRDQVLEVYDIDKTPLGR